MNKISFLLPNLRGAGVEKVVITLANEMCSRGLDIDLILLKKHGVNLTYLNKNINIIELNKNRAFSALPKLVDYFKKNDTYMISCYNHLSVIAIFAKFLSRNKNSKVFAWEHNNLTEITKIQRPYKSKIMIKLMSWLYPKAEGVIAVSHGIATDLKKYINCDIKVLYNPVITADISKLSKDFPECTWLINKEKPVFIAIGRLEPQKNFSFLLQAFALALEQIDARLIIIGEGSLQQQLESEIISLNIQNKCKLLGYKSNPYSYLANSDVFILSSIFEGLPTVLIEALECNTNIISTDCPSGPAEILENGKWGVLIPVNDIQALSKAMIDIIQKKPNLNLRERAKLFKVDSITTDFLYYLFKND